MTQIDHNIIKTIEAHKDIIKEKFSVESMSIFGSISKGTAKSDSDIDILIRFKTTPGLRCPNHHIFFAPDLEPALECNL